MKLLKFLILFSSFSLFAHTQALTERVYEIRNPQTDPAKFRKALEKIGEYLALDVLEELNTREAAVQTLTGAEAKHNLVDETPVLVTILRAGLPLNAGVQSVFPNAEVGFLGMAHNLSHNAETPKIDIGYIALPDLRDKSVILSDTMLATGGTLLDAIRILEQRGPKRIFVISAIAAKTGIERVLKAFPDVKIFAAAVDPFLNDQGYIIPGLGDAGDRSFGKKQ